VVKVDLRKPMKEILAQLSKYPVKTRLSLTGPMIVARDLAHAKLRERLEAGKGLPDYFKNHPVYYAGPRRRPRAMRRVRSARRPPDGWTAISINFRQLAAR
jgi:fumarate hydratase class I